MSSERKKTILLVEDDNDHAEIIEFYIKEYSPEFYVNRLSDGYETLNYLKEIEKLPWLIILDLKIPKHDGHEILKYLKNEKNLKRIPVVIFTTSNSIQDITKAIDAGANSYLIKPINSNDFLENIKTMLSFWKLNQHEYITNGENI